MWNTEIQSEQSESMVNAATPIILIAVFATMLRLFHLLTPRVEPPSIELELTEIDHPSMKFAYEWILPTYNWAIQRFEAGETRLQNLQTFSATVAFGIPLAAKAISSSPDKPLDLSFWFWAGIAVFFVIVVTAFCVRLRWSTQTLVGMEGLYSKEYLSQTEWEFKRAMVHHAVNHQNRNLELISARALAANIMTALLVFEVLFFVLWLRSLR